MAPSINITEKDYGRATQILKLAGVNYFTPKSNRKQDGSDFIYTPSINLYVAKERTLLGEDWFDTQKALHSSNQKMLTIPEFKEFLKYTRENHQDIYNDITEMRDSWRAEWLDADLKTKGKDLIVNYHVFNENGKIVKKSEILDKNTLMKDKTPGIDLEYWLNNPTEQGLPTKKTKSGDLYYWYPRKDNNSVARFDANSDMAILDCGRYPSCGNSYLGVRAAKQRE